MKRKDEQKTNQRQRVSTTPTFSPESARWISSTSALSESTLRHLVYAAASDSDCNPSDSSHACVVTSFEVTIHEPEIVQEGDDKFSVTQPFNVDAVFSSDAPGECCSCEYRQYVKGYQRRKLPGQPWETVAVTLRGGVPMQKDIYHEDGGPEANAVFGHRDIDCPLHSYGDPDRATGCHYTSQDAPGALLLDNSKYDIALDFMGVIINVSNSNSNVAVKYWSIRLKRGA